MMSDARNDEFKSRGCVNSSVRWRAELALMLIRNPNTDARMRWSAIIAVLWIFTLSAPTFAQQSAPTSAYAPSRCANPVAPTPSDAIDRAVVAWMLRSRTPGVSLAIVRHGQVIKEQTYGWADLSSCLPATPSMRFGIGSISKQLTALTLTDVC